MDVKLLTAFVVVCVALFATVTSIVREEDEFSEYPRPVREPEFEVHVPRRVPVTRTPTLPEAHKPAVRSCCTITEPVCSTWATKAEKYCCRYKKFLFWRTSRCVQWGYRSVKYCTCYINKTSEKCFSGYPKH